MAETTIQWAHYTFNPWVGCQRVSPGCENCYAEAYDKRVGGVPKRQRTDPSVAELRWGPKAPRVRTSESYWKQPLKWNREAEAAGERRRVFCASLADVFEDRDELIPWRRELFELIDATPGLDWLLLTKRPENIMGMLPWGWVNAMLHGLVPPNVWFGTTVEDQRRANERIPQLLSVPAAVRFLSCEPLLEPVDLSFWLDEDENGFSWRTGNAIQWVIIGGESGNGARPFHTEWARALIAQCREGDVAPFVKQLGSEAVAAGRDQLSLLRMKDRAGGDPAEWPEDLRVREFPMRGGA